MLGVAAGNAPAGVNWDAAELANAGTWVAGPWLRLWLVVAVSISTIGLFLAEISTDIYQLDGMSEMGLLPAALARKNRYGVPAVALLFEVVLILCIDQVGRDT